MFPAFAHIELYNILFHYLQAVIRSAVLIKSRHVYKYPNFYKLYPKLKSGIPQSKCRMWHVSKTRRTPRASIPRKKVHPQTKIATAGDF